MKQTSFKALYEEQLNKPTAAQVFVTKIAQLTCRKESTVRMWLSGVQEPDDLVKNILSKHFKVDADTLFPKPQTSNAV